MIGDLDTRASLEQVTRDPDGGGGYAQSWSAVARLWIGVAPAGGEDAITADRPQAAVRYRVTLRRRGDIAPGMRLVTSARTLLIHDVLDAGPRAATMVLLCGDAP